MFARLGEQTGQLPLMLSRAAKQLSTEVILTGPTGTNVADIVALLATPSARKGYNGRSLPGGHIEPGSRRRP